jgi:hypothetical protein
VLLTIIKLVHLVGELTVWLCTYILRWFIPFVFYSNFVWRTQSCTTQVQVFQFINKNIRHYTWCAASHVYMFFHGIVNFGFHRSNFLWFYNKKQSRNKPGVVPRVPGGLGSQIFMTFGTWKWWGFQPHAPTAFTHRKCSWYSFSLGAESTPGQEGVCHSDFIIQLLIIFIFLFIYI